MSIAIDATTGLPVVKPGEFWRVGVAKSYPDSRDPTSTVNYYRYGVGPDTYPFTGDVRVELIRKVPEVVRDHTKHNWLTGKTTTTKKVVKEGYEKLVAFMTMHEVRTDLNDEDLSSLILQGWRRDLSDENCVYRYLPTSKENILVVATQIVRSLQRRDHTEANSIEETAARDRAILRAQPLLGDYPPKALS